MGTDELIGWAFVATIVLAVLAGIVRQAIDGYRAGPTPIRLVDPRTEEGKAWIAEHEAR